MNKKVFITAIAFLGFYATTFAQQDSTSVSDVEVEVEVEVVHETESNPAPSLEGGENLTLENETNSALEHNDVVEDVKKTTNEQTSKKSELPKESEEATDVVQSPKKDSKPLTAKEKTNLILFAAAILAIMVIIRRFRRRCKSCGKWNAMKTIGKKLSHIEYGQTTKTTTYSQNNKRETTSQTANKYYQHHRKCKHCGFEDSVIRKGIF